MHELVAGDSFSVAQQRRDDIYTAHREAIDVRERAGQWDRRQSVTLRAPATAQPEEVRCACVCLLACVCVCVSLSLSLSLSLLDLSLLDLSLHLTVPVSRSVLVLPPLP